MPERGVFAHAGKRATTRPDTEPAAHAAYPRPARPRPHRRNRPDGTQETSDVTIRGLPGRGPIAGPGAERPRTSERLYPWPAAAAPSQHWEVQRPRRGGDPCPRPSRRCPIAGPTRSCPPLGRTPLSASRPVAAPSQAPELSSLPPCVPAIRGLFGCSSIAGTRRCSQSPGARPLRGLPGQRPHRRCIMAVDPDLDSGLSAAYLAAAPSQDRWHHPGHHHRHHHPRSVRPRLHPRGKVYGGGAATISYPRPSWPRLYRSSPRARTPLKTPSYPRPSRPRPHRRCASSFACTAIACYPRSVPSAAPSQARHRRRKTIRALPAAGQSQGPRVHAHALSKADYPRSVRRGLIAGRRRGVGWRAPGYPGSVRQRPHRRIWSYVTRGSSMPLSAVCPAAAPSQGATHVGGRRDRDPIRGLPSRGPIAASTAAATGRSSPRYPSAAPLQDWWHHPGHHHHYRYPQSSRLRPHRRASGLYASITANGLSGCGPIAGPRRAGDRSRQASAVRGLSCPRPHRRFPGTLDLETRTYACPRPAWPRPHRRKRHSHKWARGLPLSAVFPSASPSQARHRRRKTIRGLPAAAPSQDLRPVQLRRLHPAIRGLPGRAPNRRVLPSIV